MKAAVLHGIDQRLNIEDVSLSSPDPSWVPINLMAAALNHRDLWISKGQYAGLSFPIILGSDGAGYIDNQKVIFNPGYHWGNNAAFQQKSFSMIGLPANGTLCEQVYVPRENIYPIPEHLNMLEAAAYPLAGITAWRCLMSRCEAKANEKILITGIGGGVALMAMQFAVAAGLQVFVTSGDDQKITRAMEMGALGGANYNHENWDRELLSTAGSFDIIIDSAAGDSFIKLIKLASGGARIGIYGGTRGNISQISPQQIFWKQLNILGSTMGTNEEFKVMLDFISKHKLKPIIDTVYPLKDVNEAFLRMNMHSQFGKLVIDLTH